jgi:hypothetical protein
VANTQSCLCGAQYRTVLMAMQLENTIWPCLASSSRLSLVAHILVSRPRWREASLFARGLRTRPVQRSPKVCVDAAPLIQVASECASSQRTFPGRKSTPMPPSRPKVRSLLLFPFVFSCGLLTSAGRSRVQQCARQALVSISGRCRHPRQEPDRRMEGGYGWYLDFCAYTSLSEIACR